MMPCGCILRSRMMMIISLRMIAGMLMRRALGVHVAGLMMHRHKSGRHGVIAQAGRRDAQGKCPRRCNDAEQIGEGNEPSRLDPY